MLRPKARSEGLSRIEYGSLLFIHDSENGRTHELNDTAARVFKACDGHSSVDELAAQLPGSPGDFGPDLVLSALAQLGRVGLLEDAFPTLPFVPRRRFVGTALLAPIVISVATPSRAVAASSGPDGNDGTIDGDGAGGPDGTAKDAGTPGDGGPGPDGAGDKEDGGP
jgi:hypothetical protein